MSLQKIQERLIAPKGQFNAFGKYNYRSLEDICEALKPLLAEYEYSLIITDEIVMIGNRYYVKASAALVDKPGKYIASNCAYAREAETKKGMDESQITGAASSYARKYALNGLFCIDDTKDADTADNTGKTEKKADKPKAIDLDGLKEQVDLCQTEEDLNNLMKTHQAAIKAASNQAAAVALFSARKKEVTK